MVSIRPRDPTPEPSRAGSVRVALVIGGLLALAAALALILL
jgi:hypothetical protein